MLAIDPFAVLTLLASGALLWIFRKRFSKPEPLLYYSRVGALKNLKRTARASAADALPFLNLLGLLALLLAFLDPHTEKAIEEKAPLPTEGRAIFLLVDHSGSMGAQGEKQYVGGEWKSFSKLDRLKQVLVPFIQGRPRDLFGLLQFARGADVLSPLTLDHEELIHLLEGVQPVTEIEKNGTAIGYAIYKTAHLIDAASKEGSPYQMQDPVMIVFTDGLQDPNPLDFANTYRTKGLEEAAEYAKEKGIRVYMVNMEPKVLQKEFALNVKEMERAAALTGGKVVFAEGADHVSDALKEINALEKSKLFVGKPEERRERTAYAFCGISAGVLLLFISFFLGETWLKCIP